MYKNSIKVVLQGFNFEGNFMAFGVCSLLIKY